MALLRRLGRYEANKLGHALLYGILGLFRDLRGTGHRILHDSRNVRSGIRSGLTPTGTH